MNGTTFFLVRHGEAVGNLDHRFIGQSDPPLSDVGHRQAQAVAERLARLPITAIVSSDLRRARDTMSPLGGLLGIEIELEPRFREIANGEWTGLLPEEISSRWPQLWERYRVGEDVPRPGGERWSDVAARARAAFGELAENRGGQLVAIGAHAGVGLSLLTWAAGLVDNRHFFRGPFGPLANGSISIIAFPGPRVVAINDVGHLDPSRPPEGPLPFFSA